MDNLLTGRRANLEQLAEHPRFRFIEHDVTQPLPPLPTPDLIAHLASPASPVGYARYPIETLLVGSIGTYHLLQLARQGGARFLLASTSEIYGDPVVHPQPETYWGNVNPIGPRSMYDEAKRYAEALTVNFAAQHGLDARIVRIFNCYGPRMDPHDGRIIPNYLTQALRGEPITVYGQGDQTRSYAYVADLVEGLMRLLGRDGLAGQVVNLGNPKEFSALDLAVLVKQLTGTNSPIVHLPPRPEEIARRQPDITRARRLLDWEPAVPLETGLRLTIAWFKTLVLSTEC